MSWAANWYRDSSVIVGSESVLVSANESLSVIVSDETQSVTVNKEPFKSVAVSDSETEITVSNKIVSVSI